jgi:hypothetical protein
MKNRTLVILFFIISFLPSIVIAEEKIFSFSGPGMIKCKDYINYADSNSQVDNIMANGIYLWVQGYMSGNNNMRMVMTEDSKTFTNLNTINVEEQKMFLHIFCRKNQDKFVYEAADDLYIKMTK